MLVLIRWNNRNIAVPLSQLKAIGVDESTTQAIEDWHYWVAQGTASDESELHDETTSTIAAQMDRC